ncbi:MAG: lysylphosphatidylglycerol synthase transmembrane domain-containing protein [Chloroflexota bacterium]
MKRVFRPSTLLPLIVGLALIFALLTFSDLPRVVRLMSGFKHLYLLYYLLLMIVYEVVRGAQWYLLLEALAIEVPWRSQIFAFSLGEIGKNLPGGNFLQNYVLLESSGVDFGRTAAATILIVLITVGISLIGVVVLGVGMWSVWLRPLILIGVPVSALIAWAFHRYFHIAAPPWLLEHKLVRTAVRELRQLREGAADLLRPRVLALQIPLSGACLLLAGTALYVSARGIGQDSVSYPNALSIWFFTYATAQILPLPIDLGVVEVTSVGALMAIGIEKNAAIGITLVNRAVSLGASLAIALVVTLLLRQEFRAILRRQSSNKSGEERARSASPAPNDQEK